MSLAKMATMGASAALLSTSLTNINEQGVGQPDPKKKGILPINCAVNHENSPLSSPLGSPMASPLSSPLNSPQVKRAQRGQTPKGIASPKLGQV